MAGEHGVTHGFTDGITAEDVVLVPSPHGLENGRVDGDNCGPRTGLGDTHACGYVGIQRHWSIEHKLKLVLGVL